MSRALLTTRPPTGGSGLCSGVHGPGPRSPRRAVLTRHSQMVHTSRFHRAPSAWGSPSTSVHSAVLSRDSSFFICKAVCAVSPWVWPVLPAQGHGTSRRAGMQTRLCRMLWGPNSSLDS